MIERYYDTLFFRFAKKYVSALIRCQMPELSAAKRRVLAANPQQFLNIRKNLLLFAGSPGYRECVVRIADPPAGEIASVVRIAASRHSNFVAVIQLGNAAQGQRQRERQLQLFRRAPFGTRKAWHVVIREERRQQLWPRIQRIMPQHVRDSPYGRVSQQHVPQSEKHRKVKNRREPTVNPVVAAHSSCKKRRHARVRVKDLSDRRQIRIRPPQSRMPMCPKLPPHVWKRVHPVAVQPGNLRPPQAVLEQIFFDDRIFCIHVRQNPEKPAFGKILLHPGRSVRIDQRFERIIHRFLSTRPAVKRSLQR